MTDFDPLRSALEHAEVFIESVKEWEGCDVDEREEALEAIRAALDVAESTEAKPLNRRQHAELHILRDNQKRLIMFDGGAELMPWIDAHKLHKAEPYIGCVFCRDRFVLAAVQSDDRQAVEEAAHILRQVTLNRDPRHNPVTPVPVDARLAAESWLAQWEPIPND